MDIELPERITKRIANQARMNVASYISYCYDGDKPNDTDAEITCYESVVHDFVEQFRRPYSEKNYQPNREQEFFKILKKRYGDDVFFAAKNEYSNKSIWVNLGMGAKILFRWQEYQSCLDVEFTSRAIYDIYVDYADRDKVIEIIDFVRANISSWQPLAQECIRDYHKKQKIQELKATAVKSFATQKLDVCGIPYKLEQGKLRDKIFFKISEKEKAMFYLSHKNFDTAIDKIIAAAKQLKSLIAEADLHIEIKKISDYDYFQNGQL
ncbi:MAG: hypothetical protein II956_13735 [Bacteroidales bacterium]|nr:hypothetical protein [Bacteroidales bacterium]